MRKVLTGLVVAAAALVVPMIALADNQEVADEIAQRLRACGQLSNFKVGVKYQDGTAWLRGEVRDKQQMNAALKTVFATKGVTRVVNGLTIASSAEESQLRPVEAQVAAAPQPSTSASRTGTMRVAGGALNPERTSMAQRLERIIGVANQPQEQSTAEPATGRADRIASTPRQAPVQVTSATAIPQAQPQVQPQILTRATPRQAEMYVVQASQSGRSNRPIPVAYVQNVGGAPQAMVPGGPIPAHVPGAGGSIAPARYDQPCLPNHAWPSYAAYPNYAAVTYPRQYSPTAWPFIGPFYPYPQVPLGWRKVTLEWDDGWWMLDFKDTPSGFAY